MEKEDIAREKYAIVTKNNYIPLFNLKMYVFQQCIIVQVVIRLEKIV